MTTRLKKTGVQVTVLGKLIERVRREHKLTTTTLAMLSGLTDAQIKGIEEDSMIPFIDEAHRIDCARRIAIAMGLAENHFLEKHIATNAQRVVAQKTLSSVPEQLPRDVWENLPIADLKVLAKLRTIDSPVAPKQRRHGSPLLIALVVSLLLATVMLGLATLR